MEANQRIKSLLEHRKKERLIWDPFKPYKEDGTKNQRWDLDKKDIDWDLHFSGKLKQGGRLSSEDGTSKVLVVDIDRRKEDPLIPAAKICEDAFKIDHKLQCFHSPSKNWHVYKFFHQPKSTEEVAKEAKQLGQAFKKLGYKVDFGKTLPKPNGSQTGINFPFHTHQQPYDVRGNMMTKDQFIHAWRFQNFPLIKAATNLKEGEGGRPNTLCMVAALLEQKNMFQHLDEVIKNFGDKFDDTKYIDRIKIEGIHKKYIMGPKAISEAVTNIVGFDYEYKKPLPEPPPNLFGDAAAYEDYTFNKPNNKNKFPKLEIDTGNEIFFSEDIPINWAIENILPEGMTILAALPKIGKSWLALQISMAVRNATEVLGFKVKEGEVLYCAYEDNRKRIKRRFKKMGVKAEDKKPNFVYKSLGLTEGLEEQIEDWIKNTPNAQLVVIDTYYYALPQSSQKSFKERYEIDSKNLSGIHRIALDYNIAILIVHHTTKGKHDDSFNEISGSVGMQSIADTLWVINSDRKAKNKTILEIIGRDIESDAFQIGLDVNCKWLNKGRPGENLESEDQKQIINTIKELDTEHGVYPRDVVAHLKLTDKTEIGNLKKRMKRMLDNNELMKGQKNGQYKNLPY